MPLSNLMPPKQTIASKPGKELNCCLFVIGLVTKVHFSSSKNYCSEPFTFRVRKKCYSTLCALPARWPSPAASIGQPHSGSIFVFK